MSVREHGDIPELLAELPCSSCNYTEWTQVGMALKAEGFGVEVWDEWSARDTARYRRGECESKWRTFSPEKGDGVGAGTIAELARSRGVELSRARREAVAFGWDDAVLTADELPVVDPAYVEPEELPAAGEWHPAEQAAAYIRALFGADEFVGYVMQSRETEDGRRVPATKGNYKRTAAELIAALESCKDDLGLALGDYDPEAGAWVRFNPLDGHGVGNDNVTAFRYALVESDTVEVGQQLSLIRALNLPCAAIVSSGGKSVHAIVRVDAPDFDEYRRRVKRLYEECDAAGLKVDAQNKNPSRLSRLPGCVRGGGRQELIDTACGAPTWDAWVEWLAEARDDLPDEESGDWDSPVRLKPMLVGLTEEDCILRQGAKMIVVGDSKMGKSYALIDLAEAICVGGEWLGMRCAKGKVFYVNLEIDPEEFKFRMLRVWDERPDEARDPATKAEVGANFVRWNLRGHACSMDELAPKLVRRVLRHGPPGTFKAVIIDPIYKVNGGDDNDARAVARFTNTLDLVVARCGCSVIYAHHHPKGATGARKSIDRMSGSGVYGRDADTVVDFSPLRVPEDRWEDMGRVPAFRAEVSCRSFGYRKPIDALFRWPRFYPDATGELSELRLVGEDVQGERKEAAAKARKEQAAAVRGESIALVREAMARCREDGIEHNPTSAEIYERLPEDVRCGERLVGGRRVTRNRVKGWFKKDSDTALGPFHNVFENEEWGVVDDKTS